MEGRRDAVRQLYLLEGGKFFNTRLAVPQQYQAVPPAFSQETDEGMETNNWPTRLWFRLLVTLRTSGGAAVRKSRLHPTPSHCRARPQA
jgi:hypothetical protein